MVIEGAICVDMDERRGTMTESKANDHSSGGMEGTIADLAAARKGDHVRFVFAKPLEVAGGKLEVSEIVLTHPLSTGVFWLRSGNKVLRHTKFEFEKQAPFEAWRKTAIP